MSFSNQDDFSLCTFDEIYDYEIKNMGVKPLHNRVSKGLIRANRHLLKEKDSKYHFYIKEDGQIITRVYNGIKDFTLSKKDKENLKIELGEVKVIAKKIKALHELTGIDYEELDNIFTFNRLSADLSEGIYNMVKDIPKREWKKDMFIDCEYQTLIGIVNVDFIIFTMNIAITLNKFSELKMCKY